MESLFTVQHTHGMKYNTHEWNGRVLGVTILFSGSPVPQFEDLS